MPSLAFAPRGNAPCTDLEVCVCLVARTGVHITANFWPGSVP
jgi:hypothetical protein